MDMEIEVNDIEMVALDIEVSKSELIYEIAIVTVSSRTLVPITRYTKLLIPDGVDVKDLPHKRKTINWKTEPTSTLTKEAPEIFELLNKKILIAYNGDRWDKHHIDYAFAVLDLEPPIPLAVFDPYKFLQAKGYVFYTGIEDLTLEKLAIRNGFAAQKHRALPDVLLMLDVLQAIFTQLVFQAKVPKLQEAFESRIDVLSKIPKTTSKYKKPSKNMRENLKQFIDDMRKLMVRERDIDLKFESEVVTTMISTTKSSHYQVEELKKDIVSLREENTRIKENLKEIMDFHASFCEKHFKARRSSGDSV